MGESVIRLEGQAAKPKSIQRTSSFPNFTTNKEYIRNCLYRHLHSACSKMRHFNLETKVVSVMLRTKDFRVFVESLDLQRPVNSEYLLNKKVDFLLNKLYSPYVIYRSSGVYVSSLQDSEFSQLYLLDSVKNLKAQKVAKLWDSIDHKYGKNVFGIGIVPNTNNKSRF